MATMVEVFDVTVVEKNTFLLTSNIQNLFVLSRELVKELICQKKNGGHQASKESNTSKQRPTSCVGTLYIS